MRHALSACSTGDWGVYAVGGWANGNVCTGAVDFLDLRGGGGGTSREGDEERAEGNADGDTDGAAVRQQEPPLILREHGQQQQQQVEGPRWKSLAPLSTPRKLHAAAGLPDGRLFVFGGRQGASHVPWHPPFTHLSPQPEPVCP